MSITKQDLRIQYKMETGMNPTYRNESFHADRTTLEYKCWLESKYLELINK